MSISELSLEERIFLAQNSTDKEILGQLINSEEDEVKTALISNPIIKKTIEQGVELRRVLSNEDIKVIKSLINETSNGGGHYSANKKKKEPTPIWVYFPAIFVMWIISYLIDG